MQNSGDKQCDAQVILIYYNFKGVGQNIRILLSYLQIPYADIYLDEYQTQKQSLPPKVKQVLEEHPVNKALLPAIIHEGQIIYELNQIMTYICRAFDHEELLGTTIEQKSHVCEFMEIYSHRIVSNYRFLVSYVDETLSPQLQGLSLLSFVEAKYDQFLQSSGFVMELATHFLNHGANNFILGNLTILDFYFLQGARQTLALFGCIDEQAAGGRWTEIAKKYRILKQSMGEQIRKIHILRALNKFHQFFISLPFYAKKQDYFQIFNIVPKRASESTINGMKKLWAIDYKYFKC